MNSTQGTILLKRDFLLNLLEELLPLYCLIIIGPEAHAQWFGVSVGSSGMLRWRLGLSLYFLFFLFFIQIYASAPVFRRVTLSVIIILESNRFDVALLSALD